MLRSNATLKRFIDRWGEGFDRQTALRALRVAAVVGSVLVVINQGDALVGGQFDEVDLGKLVLTYCVPFCVSAWSSVQARAALAEREESGHDR